MIDLTSVPIELADFPLAGPTGERDNMQRLYRAMSSLLPPGCVLALDVFHDTGCPCEADGRPMPACTCTTVDLRFRAPGP